MTNYLEMLVFRPEQQETQPLNRAFYVRLLLEGCLDCVFCLLFVASVNFIDGN